MNVRDKKKRVLVVAHDAGGAEVIGAYVKKDPKSEHFVAYGAGPAKKVFTRLHLSLRHVGESAGELAQIMRRHSNASYALIAAPGWMSKTEINALETAKREGLKTIVYIDSWVDDRKRFGYPKKSWKKRLPDEFWAGDRYEFANLKKQFPHVPVRFVPNQYFKNEMERFHALKRRAGTSGDILFASTIGGPSHTLLEVLLRALASKGCRKIRLRFHPAEDRSRYDALIRDFHGRVHVEKSREKDLVKDMVRSRVVVGAETMALVIAMLCNVRTISYVPRGTRAILPFSRIRRAATPAQAARLI